MRSRFISLFALFARAVFSDVNFVYPPAFVSTTDFSSNIIMVEGDYKVIQWMDVSNPDNLRISVTMFQLNQTQFFGGPEYIIQNAAPDTLSTSWTVNTMKNLTISPMFYLNLFLEGETSSLTNSHYFNITAKSTTTTTSSATSSTSTSQTSTSAPLATTTPSPSPSPSIVTASSGLSTGAKVGIAVGVVGAALLGLLVGWLILGRRTKINTVQAQAPPAVYSPVATNYFEPTKMAQQPLQYPHEVAGSEPGPPMRYEL